MIRTRLQGDTPFLPNMLNNGKVEVCLKEDVDKTLAEKDKEIAELKAEISRKEGVGLRWFEQCMEERTENIRLKRALWLARAQRANEHYHRYHGKFLCPLEDIPEYVKWTQVERKCRAKAEEYK